MSRGLRSLARSRGESPSRTSHVINTRGWRKLLTLFERLLDDVPAQDISAEDLSRKPVPLDGFMTEILWRWKRNTAFNQPQDWVFASPYRSGRQPYGPKNLLERHVWPAALRAGIRKRIGWHTFRHTFGTLLKANGEDVKTVQELLRHANPRMTLESYAQAITPAKRQAQRRVVEMINGGCSGSEELRSA